MKISDLLRYSAYRAGDAEALWFEERWFSYRALDPDRKALGVWNGSTLGDLFGAEDHREGVRAFLEKREPRYVGR
jgi:hypothetical protein